jgi:hypothetical protein
VRKFRLRPLLADGVASPRQRRHELPHPGTDGIPLLSRLEASLFGDHHMHGPKGVRFYTRLKRITSCWPTGIRKGADVVMR